MTISSCAKKKFFTDGKSAVFLWESVARSHDFHYDMIYEDIEAAVFKTY